MKQFSPFPGIQVIISHRSEGSLRSHDAVKTFLSSTTNSPTSFLKLEHSDRVVNLSTINDETVVCDSVITNVDHQILSMVVADCFPIVLYDSKHQTFCLIHGGWKSLVQNLIALTLLEMHNTYQTEAKDVFAWAGPGICGACYHQSYTPVQMSLPKWRSCITEIEHKNYSIDLRQFINEELERLGVKKTQIFSEEMCTYTNKKDFFSHRRATNEGDEDGRFLIAAWKD